MAQPEYTTYPEVVAWWRANPKATIYKCRKVLRISPEKATEARREARTASPESPVEVPPTRPEGISTPPVFSADVPAFQSGTAPASGPARAPEREGTSNLTRDIQGETSRAVPLYQGEDSTWVVVGDIHVPFHDERALEKFYWFLRLLKPDGVIVNGDLLDFYELSSFSKDPRRARNTSVNHEFKLAREVLGEIARASGARWKRFREGNHCDRWQRFLTRQAPELAVLDHPRHGEDVMRLEWWLDLEYTGWEHGEYHGYWTLGDLDVEHGENVSKPAAMPSGQTARNVLIRRNRSTLINHIHTMADLVNTSRGGGYFNGIENGCLCELQPSYDVNARWSQGWSVVTVKDGLAWVEPVKVRNGRVFWRGEVL
jgi:hypothetical protein